MALSTYDEIKAAIADWLLRDDLTAVIPSFIALAEADIASDLRHWRMEKRATTTPDELQEYLPPDWLETISVALDDGTLLRSISHVEMADRELGSTSTGKPLYYNFDAGQIDLWPTPDGSTGMVLNYLARIPALSDDSPTNWLTLKYPNVILYGALVHSAAYLDDDQRAATWAALYQKAVDKLNEESIAARHAGPLIQRVK